MVVTSEALEQILAKYYNFLLNITHCARNLALSLMNSSPFQTKFHLSLQPAIIIFVIFARFREPKNKVN